MYMVKLSHLLAIVPIALLLTLSFFVLLFLRKVEEKGLKVFGYVVVSFIWLATLVIFSSAVYNMGRSSILTQRIYQKNMKMKCMAQMMQKGNMPGMAMSGMAMPGKDALSKKEKHKGMPKYDVNKGIVSKAE